LNALPDKGGCLNALPEQFSQADIETLNDFENYLSFIPTWSYRVLVNLPNKIIFINAGNQALKTASTARQYVDRILGWHPVPKKNIVYWECLERSKIHRNEITESELLVKHKSKDSSTWNSLQLPKDMKCPECGAEIIQHKRGSRTFRFASETLPGESGNVSKDGMSAEVKNTTYPEFKKWLPKFLIKKDITSRNKSMIIKDIYGGADIIVDFVSYNQPPQGTAGPQRVSIWEDEQADMAFHEEQFPGRLVAEDGDLIISCTPADRISWLYDEVFEKACVYYRTPAVIEAYARLCDRPGLKKQEFTNSPFDIAVIQAATDDNPTLVPSVINDMYKDIDEVNHPETLAIRRYGIFKQISGRIFKSFEQGTHIISSEKYFPHGIPKDWSHARGIDYHQANPWACGAMSLSDKNELFIWGELNPSPEQMVTMEIAERFAKIGSEYTFGVNLIDPLAKQIQVNTGYSTMDDLNRIFSMLYREGKCMPCSWQPWDTKSQVGRDEIKKRLKNSIAVGKPFSNRTERSGKEEYLPTIWILDYCVNFSRSLKNWRLEEWANNTTNQAKDSKETPQQKWSHFCMVIEGLLKHQGFKARNRNWQPKKLVRDKMFQGRA